jgi:hypothetical protein
MPEMPALPPWSRQASTHIHYDADQMRAYAQAYAAAAVAAEREACAALCDTVAYTHQNTPMLGPELNALKCAAAIRERK